MERLPAAPGVGASGQERMPTDPQLPGGCSEMGQVSSCSLEGDSVVPDEDHDPNRVSPTSLLSEKRFNFTKVSSHPCLSEKLQKGGLFSKLSTILF